MEHVPVTRSPTLITSSSGSTGLKICLIFRNVPPPAVVTAPLEAVVATLATLNLLEFELTLRKEFRALERKEPTLDLREPPPPPIGGGGASESPSPMKGAKGRGRVPS